MNEQKTIHEAISKLLVTKLSPLQNKDINESTCVEAYKIIFESIVELFKETGKIKLTNESVNYLAQQYYDGVLINNQHELDPNIFTVRAKLENIETKELIVLISLLRGTEFVFPIMHEVKRRS